MMTSTVEGILKYGAWSSLVSIICATGFLLFTLWDYYFFGLRILDFAALLGIFFGLFSCSRTGGRILICDDALRRPLALALIVVSYAIIGLAADSENAKTAIGFLFGVAVFFLYYVMPFDRKVINRYVSLAIKIHISALSIQLIIYYAAGNLINFHSVIGIEPRLVAAFFRPAGFFQEPAHYALNMLLLLLLKSRTSNGIRSELEVIGLISMLLTLSLWGVGATLLYVAIIRPRMLILLMPIMLITGVILVAIIGFDQFPVLLMFQDRLSNLGADGSAQARYGGAVNILESWASNPALWFGRGINSDYVDLGGANGLSFLLNSFGILGSVLLGLAYLTTIQRRDVVKLVLFFFVILTATPLWTFMMFWAWLALMARPFDPPSWLHGMPNAKPAC